MKIKTLEKKRYSILTEDLDTCYLCGKRKDNLHEVFFGAKHRKLSMEYGCVVPLCIECHYKVHHYHTYDLELKKHTERKFLEHYEATREDFLKIFHINYL